MTEPRRCVKQSYASKRAAKAVIKDWRHGARAQRPKRRTEGHAATPRRAYKCPRCPYWHITSERQR